jgi:hypothetical protein
MADELAKVTEVMAFFGISKPAFLKEWKQYTPEFKEEVRREVAEEMKK